MIPLRFEARGEGPGARGLDMSGAGFDEAAKHLGDFFAECVQFGELFFRQEAYLSAEIELGAEFSDGSFCHVKESDRVFICITLVSFSDIAGNAHRSPAHLIDKPELAGETICVCDIIDADSQGLAFLPNQQTLKAAATHTSCL